MDWRHSPSSRALALQVQSPEFKLWSYQKKKKKALKFFLKNLFFLVLVFPSVHFYVSLRTVLFFKAAPAIMPDPHK
jgi:hypothetical protein